MNTKIISSRIGYTNVFLLVQNGKAVIVDTGSRGEVKRLQKLLSRGGLKANDLSCIFLTHTHYDHAGSAAALKAISGASILVQASEQENLINGFKSIPKGTNPLFSIISKAGRMTKAIERKVGAYQGVKPDVVFNDSIDMEQFGFDALAVHIPGHTVGSSGLIVGENAFVGDCMFNLRGTIYPGFADDEVVLAETWKKMLAWDVRWFYPAHGKRFSMEQLKKEAVRKGMK